MRNLGQTLLRAMLLIAVASGLSGCSWVLFDSKGDVGIAERNLIITAILLMLIVVIPAIVLTFVFAWKYRASNTKAIYTPDWAHSTKIEIIVWGVPLIIIIALSTLVWFSTHALDPFRPLKSDVKPITIQAIATDWKWVFIYPEQGIATVNEIAIPEKTPINFQVTSNSSMNTFFIPQLGGQIYAMAGMRTQLHLIANETGNFDGMSGNYSGPGFSDMKFIAHSVNNADFQQWVEKVKKSPENLDLSGFKKLAAPSYKHPVEYFSQVEPNLFKQIIDQFSDMGSSMGSDSQMEEHQHSDSQE